MSTLEPTQDEQNREHNGILNNAIVGLLLLFTIPALLTVGGVWIVAQQGRIPGGATRSCEQFYSESLGFRIEQYNYQAGLTPFAEETFFATTDGGATWEEVFANTVIGPDALDCAAGIQQLSDDVYTLRNQKSVAITPDAGATWHTQNVCDDPRPETGRCDADPLRFRAFTLEVESGSGSVVVNRAVVDEYGLPLTEDGEVRVAETYTLTTDDYGQTWQLQNTP